MSIIWEAGMAIVLAAGTPQSAERPAGAEAFSVPFELDHGHIFVSALVNGHGPYRFGFDTGASGIGRADTSLAAALSLPTIGEAANSDGIRVRNANMVLVESLRVGGLEKRSVELLSRDYNKGRKSGLAPIMGIIGREFFADRLTTIDYPARTIRFSSRVLRPGDPGVMPYTGSFLISVCLSAGCFPAKLDSGSSRSVVIPKELVPRLSVSAPAAIGQGLRANGTATLYEMTLHEPLRIGGITVVNQKVLYADPSDAVIVIGSDFLKDYVLTIDQRHQLLQLQMPQRH